GRPIDGYTPKGCRPVDMGYNLEESLSSLALYADISGDLNIQKAVEKALFTQLKFMLPDGGIDNSFGTRNFKWTYWGSRTSDGCGLGYLLFAKSHPEFGMAALRNTQLLERCTHDGLLSGGPHYQKIGERSCVHHTFAHAKVLTSILDHGLESSTYEGILPREELRGIEYFSDIDTYQIGCSGYSATITGYDWHYLKGGHAAGGAISLVWQKDVGTVICASMSHYQMKEPNNMQLPRFQHHECLTPRIEYCEAGRRYSNIYDYRCSIIENQGLFQVVGKLSDEDYMAAQASCCNYEIQYLFEDSGFCTHICMTDSGIYILPLISEGSESITRTERGVLLHKKQMDIEVVIETGTLSLPYGEERIYHLAPGFAALKLIIVPYQGKISYGLYFRACSGQAFL
ncbi:MAG: hypothetical protein RSB57_09715, partial [Hungatella sp.]